MNKAEQIFKVFEGMSVHEIVKFLEKEECYGIPNNRYCCPLAQYAKKCGGLSADIDEDNLGVSNSKEVFSLPTPANLKDFIELFDDRRFPKLIK